MNRGQGIFFFFPAAGVSGSNFEGVLLIIFSLFSSQNTNPHTRAQYFLNK
jgi:hypothetical protein